jgi:NAD(P)-dependent dehydrogenase (short-subunit alcohol dehydrogenase family)
MASVASLMTFAGYSPYRASKWGVVGITKVAARESAARAIRVNALAPGSIETPLFMDVIRSTPNSREDYENQTPMKPIAKPDEVAAAVIWLCSDDASYITGAVLPVDGGMTV